jgi:outer membrane immunogenic protein
MKRFLSCASAVAFVFAAQAASAADRPVPAYKAPPAVLAPIFNWSGFYVGLSGGGTWGSARWRVPTFATAWQNGSGAILGGTVGYNWQAPGSAFVFGVEGDLSWSNLRMAPIPTCGGPCSTELDWLGTLRARGGVAFGAMLLYLTGGLAVGHETNSVTIATVSDTKAGWTFGGGLEVMLGAHWTAKGEYLYVRIDNALACTAAVCIITNVADLRAHVARLGLNYKF